MGLMLLWSDMCKCVAVSVFVQSPVVDVVNGLQPCPNCANYSVMESRASFHLLNID